MIVATDLLTGVLTGIALSVVKLIYTVTYLEIRTRATRFWNEVEWDWYLGEAKGQQLFWHWSPNYAWKIQHKIVSIIV